MEPKDEMEVPSLKRRLQEPSNLGTAAKVTRTVDDEQLQEFNGHGARMQESGYGSSLEMSVDESMGSRFPSEGSKPFELCSGYGSSLEMSVDESMGSRFSNEGSKPFELCSDNASSLEMSVDESTCSGYPSEVDIQIKSNNNNYSDNASSLEMSVDESTCSGYPSEVDAQVKSNNENCSDNASSLEMSADESTCSGYPSEVDTQVKSNNENCRFADNILHCKITLGKQAASQRKKEKKERKKEKANVVLDEKKSPQDKIIVENACALLNSGGGILKMVISDHEEIDDFWQQLDKTWQPLEENLINLVKPLTYNDVFHRRLVGSKEIHLFINAPQHLCTIHYNLYFAGDAGTYQASFEQAVNILQNLSKKSSNQVNVSLKDLPKLPKEFIFEEKLEYHESKQIQFKHFTQKGPILRNHGQRQSIQKHISAFGNTIGGQILLGVTDRRVVLGVDMKKNSKGKIKEQVNSMIKNMKFPVTPRRKVHWDIKFIPVSGDTTQDCAVAVIKVAGMKNLGGVFIKHPESYELLDHDTIQDIEFEQWKKRMLSGSKLETDTKGPTCSPVLKQSNGSETLKAMVQPSTASVDAAKY